MAGKRTWVPIRPLIIALLAIALAVLANDGPAAAADIGEACLMVGSLPKARGQARHGRDP